MYLATYRDIKFTRALLVNGQARVLNNALQETLYHFPPWLLQRDSLAPIAGFLPMAPVWV